MAALHAALQKLGPTPFSAVPKDELQAKDYLQDCFAKAQLIIDSVPPPPIEDTITRARSSTVTSNASCASEISISSARSDPIDPSNTVLQKEWGKPYKLSAKDNPLGMAVYKLGAKDGKGAWFARRSVHQGLGFKKWKLGLQSEFPESLEIQGAPGEGNIRGIGGERVVERMVVDGVGKIEVYHLSAQFPGPTTPRDFVTLLITSDSALGDPESASSIVSPEKGRRLMTPPFNNRPRHFMVVSKPCIHPDCPERPGFIRGYYESVEFIREIPMKPKRSLSSTDLLKHSNGRAISPSLEKAALLRNAEQKLNGGGAGRDMAVSADDSVLAEGRARGRTISFAGSRGAKAKGEAMDNPDDFDETSEENPVEWILVTRSDPGGSVPRFMVERGTPAGIVGDASKFLDWACKKQHPDSEDEAELVGGHTNHARTDHERSTAFGALQSDGHLAGLDGASEMSNSTSMPQDGMPAQPGLQVPEQTQQGSLLSNVTNAAYAGVEAYAPQTVIDHLLGHSRSGSASTSATNLPVSDFPHGTKNAESSSITSEASIDSFASAEEDFKDSLSTKSASSLTTSNIKDYPGMSQHEKELAKLSDRKKALDSKLSKMREKETKDKAELTSKEEERIRKAEEKHAREIQKQEEKYKKEVAKLEAKRQKDVAKEEERKKKALDKDEKARLAREKDEVKQALEVVSKERDILREQVGALQKENTALVARIGKLGEGRDMLREVQDEVVGARSRSSSLRKGKGAGVEATVLGGGKKE